MAEFVTETPPKGENTGTPPATLPVPPPVTTEPVPLPGGAPLDTHRKPGPIVLNNCPTELRDSLEAELKEHPEFQTVSQLGIFLLQNRHRDRERAENLQIMLDGARDALRVWEERGLNTPELQKLRLQTGQQAEELDTLRGERVGLNAACEAVMDVLIDACLQCSGILSISRDDLNRLALETVDKAFRKAIDEYHADPHTDL